MTTCVIATAGHVDHGKSTLIRALTGTDPDRLPEEKRRGLSIELGFARLRLAQDNEIHFIDVPGHARFVSTMLAGVGAIDSCMLVIAATEGWKPQTEEHLRILELLNVRCGIVVVTMADLVGEDHLAVTIAEIRAATSGSFLRDSPVAVVDGVGGRGIGDLTRALESLVVNSTVTRRAPWTRLWIDRSFAIAGAGTVVTGTLTGSNLSLGDSVQLVTPKGERRSRVRGLESFREKAETQGPHRRVAVNLSKVGHKELRRGDVLVEPDRWHLTNTVDASVQLLDSADRAVRSAGTHTVHIGSAEIRARLVVLGARSIPPGEHGLVRLQLPRKLPLVPGDLFVLRNASSDATVGGGEVLDVAPVVRPSQATPDRNVARIVAERGWVEARELERLTGTPHDPTVGRWVVDRTAAEVARRQLRASVAGAGGAGLDLALLEERARALVVDEATLEVRHGRVYERGTVDTYAGHPYLAVLERTPFNPPAPLDAGVSQAEVGELIRRRLVVHVGDLCFSPAAITQAGEAAADLLQVVPLGFTVADFRTHLRTSRRFALALLARLDHEGVTRRRGDLRIGGPRLPPTGAAV